MLSIILSKKDMLRGASHNCSESQQTGLPALLPEINIVSSLTLPSGLKKKRKKFLFVMNRGQVSPWERSQRINILLHTVSQCHAARFTFHVGSLCGMCTDWDTH